MGLTFVAKKRLACSLPCLLYRVPQRRFQLVHAALPDLPVGNRLLLKYSPLQTERLDFNRKINLWKRIYHADHDIHHDAQIGDVTLRETLEEYIRPGVYLARRNDLGMDGQGLVREPTAQDEFVLAKLFPRSREYLAPLPSKEWLANYKKNGVNRISIKADGSMQIFAAAMISGYLDIKHNRKSEWHVSVGKFDRNHSEKFYELVSNSPHLWPEFVIAAMRKGARIIIGPQTNEQEYTWATGSQSEPDIYETQLRANRALQIARRDKQSADDAKRDQRYTLWRRFLGNRQFFAIQKDVFKNAYHQKVHRDAWDDLLLKRLVQIHSAYRCRSSLTRLFRDDYETMGIEAILEDPGAKDYKNLNPSPTRARAIDSERPISRNGELSKAIVQISTPRELRRAKRTGRKRSSTVQLQSPDTYNEYVDEGQPPDAQKLALLRAKRAAEQETRNKANEKREKIREYLQAKRSEEQSRFSRRTKTIEILMQNWKKKKMGQS